MYMQKKILGRWVEHLRKANKGLVPSTSFNVQIPTKLTLAAWKSLDHTRLYQTFEFMNWVKLNTLNEPSAQAKLLGLPTAESVATEATEPNLSWYLSDGVVIFPSLFLCFKYHQCSRLKVFSRKYDLNDHILWELTWRFSLTCFVGFCSTSGLQGTAG